MKDAWSCRIDFEVENVAIGEDYIVIGSGSYVYCIDVNTKNIAWKRKMIVTFYRDPFSDVAVTAVDARGSMIAVGTNFMDGKVYLFTKTGKLLWEHQFATIASLGWRPEDVTAVSVGNNCIAIGTEFTGEFVYVYSFERKRILQKRVKGTVKAIAVDDILAVGTDNALQVFDLRGKEKFSLPVKVTDVEVADGKVVVCSKNEIIAIDGDGKDLWRESFDREVRQIFCNDYVYAIVGDRVAVMSMNGSVVEDVELEHEPIGIGEAGVLIRDGNTLKMLPL
jgi:outer membrane protein assembly factor BamB